MADTSGMADIRGIQINKVVEGYANRLYVFKSLCKVTPTKSREIRWYQMTAGTLDTTDTTGMTTSRALQAYRARPEVIEPSFTRNTSYVKTYMYESPTISDADIKDSDVNFFMHTMEQLTLAVTAQVDARIYNVLTESDTPSTVNTNASTAAWDAASGQNPIEDIEEGKKNIRSYDFNIDGGVIILNPANYYALVVWLATTKQLNTLSSDIVKSGNITEICGLRVIVSNNVTDNYATIFIPQKSVEWMEFTPVTGATIDEPLIGKKFRVKAEGEGLLINPRSVNVITAV